MSVLSTLGLLADFREDPAGPPSALFSGGLVEWSDSQTGKECLLPVDESAHSSGESM